MDAKETYRQLYRGRINQVQDYIEKHLDEDLRVENLAKVAAFSEFHFQRIYRSLTGESIYAYIKRLRLNKAMFLLKNHQHMTILDVALNVGFSNQSSFAKAFKNSFQISASKARKGDCDCKKLISPKSDIRDFIEAESVFLQTTKDQHLVYTRYSGPYKGDAKLFSSLFSKLYGFVSQYKLMKPSSKWMVIYHDFGEDIDQNLLRISVCMTTDKEIKGEDGFGFMLLEGGTYLVGDFLLQDHEYQKAWNYMFLKCVPESGYIPRDTPSYEVYPPSEQEGDKRQVHIYIPVQKL